MKHLPRKEVIYKQLAISGIPLVIAIIYAAYGYLSVEEDKRTITTLINYFAAGFFFIMWLVGQYLRTAKQIDDSANYEVLQAGISDVKESIRQLHALQGQKAEKPVITNSLLAGAQKAINDGHVLAGLMQSGVAFEQAIITKAEKHDFYREPRTPVYKAIQSLSKVMNKNIINELFAVWKLRNQLVHLSPEAAKELESRPELYNYFEWAISELEK
ncbi:MAG: hypothetical protein KZQ83_12960 [gamma proteobacterium symbiont of Taylorina sp.]|nr:hypothetical protein [gamma proteobacterium symbiont of Taylorina sp.]